MTISLVEEYLAYVRLRATLQLADRHREQVSRLSLLVFNWYTIPLLGYYAVFGDTLYGERRGELFWAIIGFAFTLTFNYIVFWYIRRWRVRWRIHRLDRKIAWLSQDLFVDETLNAQAPDDTVLAQSPPLNEELPHVVIDP